VLVVEEEEEEQEQEEEGGGEGEGEKGSRRRRTRRSNRRRGEEEHNKLPQSAGVVVSVHLLAAVYQDRPSSRHRDDKGSWCKGCSIRSSRTGHTQFFGCLSPVKQKKELVIYSILGLPRTQHKNAMCGHGWPTLSKGLGFRL
jgi:hypothetical protein